jgi:hypothetical protein
MVTLPSFLAASIVCCQAELTGAAVAGVPPVADADFLPLLPQADSTTNTANTPASGA